ncbi:response regulator transcription factor [Cellulomonas cellasea]|uniref:DNA-binding response OmpR family regulator n=1 Tax=Cellulomonas cellasea TaxID=43670 RepID=A0A7W4UGG4_9CELL|nr:response regulator transcription factor [Cellulomonas cellasea]MBB2923727.1 DNA-binding response OmpR family regulator [Cellulomonas cellasea]
MRVLIVEDDVELAAALDDALRHEGYRTSVATTGTDALVRLGQDPVDIVLLDRDLPVLSGDAVVELIVAHRIPVKVLMLTAASGVNDRVEGLDLGADDYLTKPFAYPELLARIRALRRRADASTPTVLTHGDLTLDTGRRLAQRGQTVLRLTPKEYGVLEVLLAADGGFVTVGELLDEIWGGSADVQDNVVKTAVYLLRKKLGPPDLIVSEPRNGYRIP